MTPKRIGGGVLVDARRDVVTWFLEGADSCVEVPHYDYSSGLGLNVSLECDKGL